MRIAIIPAGGKGTRMGMDLPKQFLLLEGKPIIIWTLEVFERHPLIDWIAVACLETHLEHLKNLLRRYGLKKVRFLVPGGASRQESVANALYVLPSETKTVLVHDAARPLVSLEVIEEVIKAIEKEGAALAACPAKDTIKEIEGDRVKRTLPRERIFLAQTPQGARYSILLKAFERAKQEGFEATDEAGLLERLGIPVKVVLSPATNLKITTAEDLVLATCLLRQKSP